MICTMLTIFSIQIKYPIVNTLFDKEPETTTTVAEA